MSGAQRSPETSPPGGTGYDDVLVGAHVDGTADPGTVFVYSGTAAAADRADAPLDALHNGVLAEFDAFDAAGAITPRFVRPLIELFDRLVDEEGQRRTWLVHGAYYDEWATIQRIREDQPRAQGVRAKPPGTVTYEEMARFSAWCEAILGAAEPPPDLHDWMRVIANLTRATAIDRGERLRRALVAMRRLRAAGPILEHLVRGGDVDFFLSQQVREERIKAGLIRLASAARARRDTPVLPGADRVRAGRLRRPRAVGANRIV